MARRRWGAAGFRCVRAPSNASAIRLRLRIHRGSLRCRTCRVGRRTARVIAVGADPQAARRSRGGSLCDSKATGWPWEVSTVVPDEIYLIPADSPVHNTTYVYVYSHDTEYVYTGYTSGYWGVYIGFGAVMYGAGWYHSPYYYYNPFYPYNPYYYGHWASYGYSSYYNPHTGTYGRGAVVYGPYGGYGAGARYNPSTGAYARGAMAWGTGGAAGWAQAYNPSTGRGAMTYQGANSYSNWGTSAIRGDNGWAQTAHYRDADQGAFGYRTSEGGRGGIAYKDGNVYAGRDGNVYKRDESGNWQTNNNGTWDNVDIPSGDRSQFQQNAQNRNIDTSQIGQRRESTGGGSGFLSNNRDWTRPNSTTTNRALNKDSRSRTQGTQQQRNRQNWQRTGQYKGYSQNRQRTRQRSGGRRR